MNVFLKRCPFCGEVAIVKQLLSNDVRNKTFVVGCDGKNGSLCPGYIWKCSPFYLTRKQAVKYWNDRGKEVKWTL